MKTTLFILAILLNSSMLNAQISFRTGDAGLDADLNVMNNDAKKDLPSFTAELSSTFNVAKDVVTELLEKALEPAEVYLSMKIGEILNIPVEDVVKSYEENKDKGWGAIAKELGIKPGSPEFHALKGQTKGSDGKGGGNSNGKGKGKS